MLSARFLTIAKRDYLAAVRTKAFLISLLLLPLLSSLAVSFQVWSVRADKGTTKTFAIVDRTKSLRSALEDANARRTATEIKDPGTGLVNAPIYALLFIDPSADDRDAIAKQRLELSQRHQRAEFEGFLEIGPDVFELAPRTGPPDDRTSIRFQTEKELERMFASWAWRAVNDAVQMRRFERRGMTPDVVQEIQTPVRLQNKGLTRIDRATGQIADSTDDHRMVSFALPAATTVMMLIVVLLAAMPAMQSIVEEKQQRIAEVLLGCVSPFELMLGKLLGVVAVSLTISGFYLAGSYFVVSKLGASNLIASGLVAWFILFLLLAVMVYGSLFMAVGAAAGDMKETQSLQMPVTMLIILPTLLLGTLLREPNGKVAVIGSFVPFSAPMLMMARLSTGADVPVWQPAVAAAGVLLTALACVWASGRVFRVGLLMQGKGVRFGDLLKWVVRG